MQGSRTVLLSLAISVCCLVLAVAQPVRATDFISGASKLKLKRSASGKSKLVLVIRDSSVPFPATENQAVESFFTGLDVYSLGLPQGRVEPLRRPYATAPQEPRFEVSGNTGKRTHKFRHKNAPDQDSVFKLILWREGRGFKIVMKDAVLPLDQPTGGVGLRFRWHQNGNTDRLCTVVSGAAVRKDRAGSFSGSNAPAPLIADCNAESIVGVVSPAECGDGIVSSTESCDGAYSCDQGTAEWGQSPFLSCIQPGQTDECECCVEESGSLTLGPSRCCTPSVTVTYPSPIPFGGFFECISDSCESPHECDPGDECLPDNSCCGGEGNKCGNTIFGPVRDCCGPLTCAFAPGSVDLTCQPATACTLNADCATDFCNLGLCDDQL